MVTRPNIVVIVADDLGYGDISPAPYGGPLTTPRLERMAAEGVSFSNFYVSAPVCSPTRAALLTGCYHPRVGLNRVLLPADSIGLNPSETTVATLARAAGYRTTCIGKWHLGDQPPFLPTQHGFEDFFGVPYSNDMWPRGDHDGDPRPRERGYPPLPLMRDEEVVDGLTMDQSFLTEIFTDEAVRYIERNRDEPFLLYLAYTAVHVPLSPGKAFIGRSGKGAYGDWVLELDASAGRILDTLRELSLDQNTLVLFTSDNGPALEAGGSGGVLRGGKATTWEGGLRVPAIAWWPGTIPSGKRCDHIATVMDLLPTIAGLTGAELPPGRDIDGYDLGPLLIDPDHAGRLRDTFYYFGHYPGIARDQNVPILCAVRQGPWKLHTRVATPRTGEQPPYEATEPQLYNLDDDAGESRNIAAEHQGIVAELSELIRTTEISIIEASAARPCGRVPDPVPLLYPSRNSTPTKT